MKIISREEALDKGLRHYYTGKPCVNGHIDRIYVKNKQCMACRAEYNEKRNRRYVAETGFAWPWSEDEIRMCKLAVVFCNLLLRATNKSS